MTPAILKGVKVLIVDDNRTNRRILEGLVKRWGMIPRAVSDGEKALDALAEAHNAHDPFNLILTDMHMPKMDGFGLVEQIKKDGELATSTIMMLTSGGQRGDAARCGELGISAYLLKPVRQTELREAIARVLTPREKAGIPAMITRYSLNETVDAKQKLHILLAEDNEVNQKLALRLLEKRGHHVVVAGNGKQALAALEKRPFDLVLMDVQMPEMDGLEATAQLRTSEKGSERHQPVVAMTALVMKGDRERCIEAGMDGYLSKPIRPQELDAVLDTYVALERVEEPLADAEEESQQPAAVNTQELMERIDNDVDFLAELLELFRRDYPGLMRTAREAIRKGDAVGLQRSTHTLKGALANLAAPTAARLSAELEAMGKQGELRDAEDGIRQLEDELPRVVELLQELCVEVTQ